MKFLIIGSGLMGSALAFDLVRSKGVERVTLADMDPARMESTAARLNSTLVKTCMLDVSDFDAVIEAMQGHDCAIGAVSYRFNFLLAKAALEAGVHFLDLGGNDEVVQREMSLDEMARASGIAIVPNCGLAPGMANVIAAQGAKLFDTVDTIKVRVGGLPQHPQPPLNYQLVFSVEGLVNEYSGKALTLRNSKITQIDTMTEVEEISFPAPFGTLEAFHTSGGASLLPAIFEGKVRELDYKTIRYPGHCERFKTLLDLGFASAEPMTVGSNLLTAKEMFYELLKKRLAGDSPDAVLVKIVIQGTRNDKVQSLTYLLIDFYDQINNITAMMRTTSYPTSVIAQMVVDGRIAKRGVFTPEFAVPLQPFLEELRSRKIAIEEEWSSERSRTSFLS